MIGQKAPAAKAAGAFLLSSDGQLLAVPRTRFALG